MGRTEPFEKPKKYEKQTRAKYKQPSARRKTETKHTIKYLAGKLRVISPTRSGRFRYQRGPHSNVVVEKTRKQYDYKGYCSDDHIRGSDPASERPKANEDANT